MPVPSERKYSETRNKEGKEGLAMPRESEVLNTEPNNDPLRRYFADVSKNPLLTATEERELAERAYFYKDRRAIEKLITSNLRLVVKVALNYYNGNLNPLDLIQEGNVGLIHAAEKYDPRKGTKFSTYASFWIKAYILKYIMNIWSIVKIGTTQSQRRLFFGLNKAKERISRQGIEPESTVLAKALDIKEEDIEEMEIRLSSGDVSLEGLSDHGDEMGNYKEVMQEGESIEDMVEAKEKREMLEIKIKEFEAGLNQRDRFVFENRIMSENPLRHRRQ